MKYPYIDVHCHPNLHGLKEDQDTVIAQMKEGGVSGIVVGVDLSSSQEAVALAEKYDNLWATVGLHPNRAGEESFNESEFEKLLSHPRVVGVGECGLDYFRVQGDLEIAKKKQWGILEQQIALALRHGKPLMVHCRPSKNSMDAYRDFLDYTEPYFIPDTQPNTLRGNMHFFVGNLEVARRFWARGFTTSFTGVLTFTTEYDAVVTEAPLSMMLTETDAPYAAPVPHRGTICVPSYVPLVTQAIARIRGQDEECIRSAIVQNAERVFGIKI